MQEHICTDCGATVDGPPRGVPRPALPALLHPNRGARGEHHDSRATGPDVGCPVSIFKRNRPATHVPESSSTVTGATFGPWATHETRCKCSVCR